MSATAQDELSTLQENLTCQGSEATTSIFSHVVSFFHQEFLIQVGTPDFNIRWSSQFFQLSKLRGFMSVFCDWSHQRVWVANEVPHSIASEETDCWLVSPDQKSPFLRSKESPKVGHSPDWWMKRRFQNWGLKMIKGGTESGINVCQSMHLFGT